MFVCAWILYEEKKSKVTPMCAFTYMNNFTVAGASIGAGAGAGAGAVFPSLGDRRPPLRGLSSIEPSGYYLPFKSNTEHSKV